MDENWSKLLPKRIAMISDHASPIAKLGSVDSGGQNVYVSQVSRHLARLGHQVDIFTRRDAPDQPEVLEWEDGVRIIYVPAGPAEFVPKEKLYSYMDAFTAYVVDFMRQQPEPYHLVHANFWMSTIPAMELKKEFNIPFLVIFHALGKVRRIHQGQNDEFPDDRFTVEEDAIREAAMIIAECPQEKEDLLQLYHADPTKVIIIPGGFDPKEVWPVDRTEARKKLGLPLDEHIILQLGRMVPRKGVDNAIRGFARLVKKHGIPARLLVVGGPSNEEELREDPEMQRLHAIALKEGVARRVTFTGGQGREALKDYYSAADVFISTPWYEPFGITPIEAMACGTPVIGSNVGGIKFTVVDGETGFLVPPNDPDTLSERLAVLLSKPRILKRMSERAIKRANRLFTWDKVGEMTDAVYAELKQGEMEAAGIRLARRETIENGFEVALQTLQLAQQTLSEPLSLAAEMVSQAYMSGNKVLICGNGGSAADAQHFAGELVGRFLLPGRKALPAQALTADTAFLTAWANDLGYDQVFSRQVEAFGKPGDILFGLSTSGESENVIAAFEAAREMGITTIALLGGSGGRLLDLSDLPLVVPIDSTPRIQEIHILLIHLLCEMVERLFAPGAELFSETSADEKTTWNIETGIPVQIPGSKDYPL